MFSDSFAELKPKCEVADLARHIVKPVVRGIRPMLKKHALQEGKIILANFEVIPNLALDHSMMQQVFFNLLTNAIKYRDVTSEFAVTIEAGVKRSNSGTPEHYTIDVVDGGIGLDAEPDAPERKFLPWVRGEKSSREKDVSGVGIGLTLVREIIEAHGGTVTFIPNAPLGGDHAGTGVSEPPNFYRKPTRIRVTLPASLCAASASVN